MELCTQEEEFRKSESILKEKRVDTTGKFWTSLEDNVKVHNRQCAICP